MIRFSTLGAALALATACAATPSAVFAQSTEARSGDAARADRTRPVLEPWSREVAIADRGLDEQRSAQALAMREVLLANSGDKTLLNRDDVRAGLREAERYVERFDFRAPPPGTVIAAGTPLTDRVRESGEATQLMRVTFDRVLLSALIEGDADVGAAGEPSPDAANADPFASVSGALMWLLVEDGRREILVSDEAARNVRARAREIAGARGVALRYPSGDEEDTASIAPADIRDSQVERLRRASGRYAERVVLSGHLARDEQAAWRGTWTKFADETVASETFTTDSLDEALQAGIAWLSTSTSPGEDVYRYGGAAASDAEALVWFGALDSVNAYATVLDFLAGVPGVDTVYPREVDERGMTFTVVPRAALPAIASAADGLSWLRRTNPPVDDRAMAPPDPATLERPGVRGPGAFDETIPVETTSADRSIAATDRAFDRIGKGLSAVERGPDGRVLSRPQPAASLARDAELAYDYLR